MKIINQGTTNTYQKTCTYCSTIFTFTTQELIPRTNISITPTILCPGCYLTLTVLTTDIVK